MGCLFAIAPKGRNGIGLFVSDGFIARQLQLGHRETVSKYRHLAIELGWLTLTGKNHNRVKEVNISFPDEVCYHPSYRAGSRVLLARICHLSLLSLNSINHLSFQSVRKTLLIRGLRLSAS